MKKIFVLISFLVLAAFAQNENANVVDSDRVLQRPAYSFQTAGFLFSYWSNWEDSEKNPDKDGVLAFPHLRYGHIWEMTTHGAITAIGSMNAKIGDDWQIHANVLLGGRYSFLEGMVSPFVGGGLGIGMQIDSHFKDWDFGERWSLGLSLGGELGVTFFHNSTTQLELGVGYDVIAAAVDFGKSFSSINVFFAINY